MKQRITIVTSNDKNLNNVLGKHDITVEDLNETTKEAWEFLLSMLNLRNNSEQIYIESVNTIDD